MYKGYVSTRYFVADQENKGQLDWGYEGEDLGDDILVSEGKTVKECIDRLRTKTHGYLWTMYPAAYVLNEEGGEEWASTPVLYKCDSCGHEKWDRVENKPSKEVSNG